MRVAAVAVLAVGLLVGAGFVVPARTIAPVVPGESVVDEGAVALRPGSARSTEDRVRIEGIDIYPPDGGILFTTVAIDADVSVWEWVEAEIDDAIDLVPRKAVFGDRTRDENRERNLQMMQVSKETAVLVALERLGVDVVDATGIGFDEVLPDGPAAGLLEPGEVIIALDGHDVTDLASLRALLEQRSPGDEAVLTVEDLDTGEIREVTIVLGEHPDGLPGGFIGIGGVRERLVQNELPFEVDIDSGSIGGPSAGLAFTLTILDLLTPGDLTGGHRVAVTGTISIDGTVGNVGGVAQKAAAARAAGAEVFIVPADLVEEARRTAGDMRVVGVADLDEALEVLAGLGGDVAELALVDPGDRTG